MSNVQVGPPNLAEADKGAVAVAKFLRHHKLLKQRQGILNGKRQDFFRVKRAVRALESDAYKKAMRKSPHLPQINSRAEALEAFRLLPLNRLAFRVIKLETEEAKKAGLKPVRAVPVLNIYPQQEFGDDMYYTWFYEPVQMLTYVYAAAALAAIFAVVLFPLWPAKMRLGVWYLSMGMIVLLAGFFGIAIVRLIIFCITYFVLKPGFWLFPNLFEDVGFVDSFIPLYAWHGQNVLPGSNKKKSGKKRNLGFSAAELAKKNAGVQVGAQQHAHQQAAQQAAQQIQQQKMQQLGEKVKARYEEIIKGPHAPKNPQEDAQLRQHLLNEELGKLRQEMMALAQRAQQQAQQAQAKAASASQGGATQIGGPASPAGQSSPTQARRIVTLEEDDEGK